MGVTLIELAIAMMVMSILAIGVASLIRGGVESQMNDRLYNTMHLVVNNLLSELRFDLMRSTHVEVLGGGTQLSITDPDGNTILYEVYSDPSPGVAGVSSIRRTAAGQSKVFNRQGPAEFRPALRMTCSATIPAGATPCFQGFRLEPTATPGVFNTVTDNTQPTQIRIADLSIYSPSYIPGSDSSYLRSFGPPRYRLQQTTFDVLSNLEFN
ncbi:MAG: hypothetical protein VKJ04_07030 [Vampirovibrionales bacterium]|nr:hypothetical protein [Vampirovibrionales bacterium]